MKLRLRSKAPVLAGLLALTIAMAISCAPRAPAGQEAAPGAQASAPLPSLKVGLMPAIDIAPLLIAAERGYFAAEGVDLSYEIFPNAQVRQSAIQAGSVDGILTDLIALALSNAGGFPLKATTATDGYFAVLASSAAAAQRGGSLSIGLMEASVSNFLADQWLSSNYRLEKTWVTDPSVRLETVVSGGTQAALLPEPLVSVGKARGLGVLAQSSPTEPSVQAFAFTPSALEGKAPAIRAFHRAWDRAVADVKADPAIARAALAAALPNLSPAIAQTMTLPAWEPTRLPDEAWLATVISWTGAMAGKDLGLKPADLVDARFAGK
jgi:NitT/TauT family transport system substrate-binding protein